MPIGSPSIACARSVAQLVRQPLGLVARVALGVDVDEGLVLVGKHLHPAAVVEEDLDAVGQIDVRVGVPLVERRA